MKTESSKRKFSCTSIPCIWDFSWNNTFGITDGVWKQRSKRKFSGVQAYCKNAPYIALPFRFLFGIWKPIAPSKIQIITCITLTCINYLKLRQKLQQTSILKKLLIKRVNISSNNLPLNAKISQPPPLL